MSGKTPADRLHEIIDKAEAAAFSLSYENADEFGKHVSHLEEAAYVFRQVLPDVLAWDAAGSLDPDTPSQKEVKFALRKALIAAIVQKHRQAEDDAKAVKEQRARMDDLVRTADDIRNQADVGWMLEDLFPTDTTVVVAGARAALKSFFAQDLAFRVAAGSKVDYFGKKIRQGWAFVVAAEGAEGYKKRLAAWEQHNDAKVERLLVYPRRIDMSLPGSGAMIADWLGSRLPAGAELVLCVFDTLAKVRGAKNENQQEIGEVLAQLDEVRLPFAGCTALVLHHVNAGGTTRGNTTIGDDPEGLVLAKRNEKAGPFVTDFTVEKLKDEAEWSLRIELQRLVVSHGKDGKPITSLAVVGAKVLESGELDMEQLHEQAEQSGAKDTATVALAVAALKAAGGGPIESASEMAKWMKKVKSEAPEDAGFADADTDRGFMQSRLDALAGTSGASTASEGLASAGSLAVQVAVVPWGKKRFLRHYSIPDQGK